MLPMSLAAGFRGSICTRKSHSWRTAAASRQLHRTLQTFKCQQQHKSKPPANPCSSHQKQDTEAQRSASMSSNKPGLQLAENWRHQSQPVSCTTLPIPSHICPSSTPVPATYCVSSRSCGVEKPRGLTVAQEIFCCN